MDCVGSLLSGGGDGGDGASVVGGRCDDEEDSGRLCAGGSGEDGGRDEMDCNDVPCVSLLLFHSLIMQLLGAGHL